MKTFFITLFILSILLSFSYLLDAVDPFIENRTLLINEFKTAVLAIALSLVFFQRIKLLIKEKDTYFNIKQTLLFKIGYFFLLFLSVLYLEILHVALLENGFESGRVLYFQVISLVVLIGIIIYLIIFKKQFNRIN